MKHRTFQSNNSLLNYYVLLNRDVFTVMFYLLAITKKAKNKTLFKQAFIERDINERSCNSFEEITLLLLSTDILTHIQLQPK